MDLAQLLALGMQVVARVAYLLTHRPRIAWPGAACEGTPEQEAAGDPGDAAERRQRRAAAAPGGSVAPPPQLPDLPDVADALGGACCDPCLLARLSSTQRQWHGLISNPGFAARRASELSAQGMQWVSGCTSLEEIALCLAVAKLCACPSKNHVYFPYGGGTQILLVTMPLLQGAALLAGRHEGLKLHVDAHAGVAAPSGVATSCSQVRAKVVMQQLVALGVSPGRLSGAGWGKRISAQWLDPEDEAVARAEVFFRFHGKEYPQRSSHYSAVPSPQRPGLGLLEPEDSSSDEDDTSDDAGQGAAALLRHIGFPRHSFARRSGPTLRES
mmetsp:Transcript_107826/g.348062  ORF Transcript_107826/g.348062 Transcript_107826/m.348062 type:complete len:328 (-) Transcript_107826:118-1101(-)